jgi:hypothetical protein
MASSVHIDGSLPDPGDSSTKGLVFAGGWGVEYDWALDRATATNQPRRLSAIGFPAPFDSSLEGSNLAKTKILAKYNTVNQLDRLHGGTKPAHAVRE